MRPRDLTKTIVPFIASLRRSAHCHYTASARHRLWDRLARWVGELDGSAR
ncbi:MAG: hypothetical protein ACREQY_05095 [Candidatus Binatia bacterium]